MAQPPRFEVADVIRCAGAQDGDYPDLRLSPAQRRVLRRLAACRTARLGGHLEACDACGHQRVAYNSCRDRHCPKCQASRGARWVEARERDLLPVPYFHGVFTLPQEAADLALANKRVVYEILFRCSWQTLRTIAADPKRLGANIGALMVLHTWGQTLTHHPHVHCVIPGGGLSPDGRWIGCRPGYLLPVKVLSKLFRGKFIAALKRAYDAGDLAFPGRLAPLADAGAFDLWCDELRRKDWVVYMKPPFGGPEQVLKYLARYTHRVAIGNRRIVGLGAQDVTFLYKDYAHGDRQRTMTLSHTEFLRRFLMHVVPKGLMRIRYYGLLANRCRKEELARCRAQLKVQTHHDPDALSTAVCEEGTLEKADSERSAETHDPRRCPVCRVGRMVRIDEVPPCGPSNGFRLRMLPPRKDTS